MSTFCPNLSNKQVKQDFNQLIDMVGENIAYYLWNKYEGDMSQALGRAQDIQSQMNIRSFELKPGMIIFGHPGIGKTYAIEHALHKGKFIDWDVEFNEKRDKWIEEHSGTKKGTPEYKKARNKYMIHPEEHPEYMEFITQEWNRVKNKTKQEGKILFASPHNLLKSFTSDFDLIINLDQSDFVQRNMQRGGDQESSLLWKQGIDETISNVSGIRTITLKQGEYLSDFLNKHSSQQSIRRRKNFTAAEFAASSRLSSLLRELFPEISVEYVDGIEGGHVGKAEYEALKILVDMFESTSDTEPHEYAHFYIEMFKNSELVQNGIKEFGSKEKLVQAVGVRAIEMDGKARNWWQKFKDFIKKLLNKNKYAKEALLAELTDAFLTRSDIGEGVSIYDLLGVDYQSTPDISTVQALLQQKAASIMYSSSEHSYVDRATGKAMRSVSKWLEALKYSTYDADSADSIQKEINDDAREGGSRIHAVMESLWLGTFKESDYLQYFSSSALKDMQKIHEQLNAQYEFVAAEAMLSDVKHNVAGTADLIVRERSTGKYVLLDYKSKMFAYNNTKLNKKGNKLRGFLFATSKEYTTLPIRDKYDAQLSAYRKMLNDMGIPVEEHGIIPLVYAVNGNKVTKMMISDNFGGEKSVYNKNLKERHFASLKTPENIHHDIYYGIFQEKSDDEKDEIRQKMIKDLRDSFEKVIKHLTIQKDILKARGRRTASSQVGYLLDQFEDIQELEALFKYTKHGIDQLEAISKNLKRLISLGKNATWDMSTLQEYKDVATSYQVVGEISADIERYSSLLDSKTVSSMRSFCNQLQNLQTYIISECNNKLAEMYMEDAKRYVKNIEMDYRDEYEKEFKEKNPKQNSETQSQYNARKQAYIDKKVEDNRDEIEAATKKFLTEQADVANAGFEVTGVFAMVNSALESPDPFVQYSMMKYWEVIRDRDRKYLEFQAKLQKILKEYRKKYGYSNFQNDKNYFEDFVEVTDQGCYLVNPWSASFIDARDKAFTEIRESDKSSIEKEIARLEWMDKNFPISDKQSYDNEFKTALDVYFQNKDKDESLKKQWDALEKNNKLEPTKQSTLWQLLGKKEITGTTYEFIKDLKHELDKKYRAPNTELYPNTKYEKLLALKASNDPKWQLYELFKSVSEDIDGRMGSHKLKLEYRLPGVVKRGREIVGRDGVKKAMSAYIQRESFIMADEVLRGSYVNQAGVQIDMIPLPFKKALNEEEQSFDLPTVYAMWYSAAMEFLGKREIEALMLETQRVLDERLTKTNKQSLLKKGSGATVNEKKENTAKQFRSWMDIVFYGNRLEDYGAINLPASDKQVDVAKLIKALVQWQNTRVMTANMTSWINNAMVGEITQIEDVLVGRYLSSRAYHKASKIFGSNLINMAADVNSVVPKNKYNRIADYFGLFHDSPNQSITGFLRHSISDVGHVGQAVGDRFLQLRYLLGMLCELQAVDKDGNVLGDMLDFIDINDDMQLVVDPKVTNFDTATVDKFALGVQKTILRNHGNYSSHWSVAISNAWYGWMGLSLRNWIASSVERRFGREQVDSVTGTRFKGFYRTTFKWLFTESRAATSVINFIASHIKDGEKYKRQVVHWSELSDRQKQDLKSTAIEFGVAALAYATYCLLGLAGDDDDNDALAMLRYQSYRLFTDLTFYTLPTSFTKILQDPFPTMNLLTDATNVLIQLVSPMEEYNSGRHMFDNKLLDKTIKLLPAFKQIHRVDNISAEMEYFIRKA